MPNLRWIHLGLLACRYQSMHKVEFPALYLVLVIFEWKLTGLKVWEQTVNCIIAQETNIKESSFETNKRLNTVEACNCSVLTLHVLAIRCIIIAVATYLCLETHLNFSSWTLGNFAFVSCIVKNASSGCPLFNLRFLNWSYNFIWDFCSPWGSHCPYLPNVWSVSLDFLLTKFPCLSNTSQLNSKLVWLEMIWPLKTWRDSLWMRSWGPTCVTNYNTLVLIFKTLNPTLLQIIKTSQIPIEASCPN